MGRCASPAQFARRSRSGAVSHRPHPLSARHHGCAVAQPSGAADQLHESRAGRRDLPGHGRDRRASLACDWLPTKWDWIDPAKDASAEILQIEAGLKSRSQAIAERGFHAEQVDREIAAERKREAELGLDFRRPGSPAQAAGSGSGTSDTEDQQADAQDNDNRDDEDKDRKPRLPEEG